MQRFSFRLETLRRLREHKESAAAVALANELAVGEQRNGELRRAESALEAARTSGWSGTVTGRSLVAREAFLARRERERRAAELEARSQEEQIARQRAAFERAAVDRAALERLKERRLAAHTAENTRLARQELTEITLARFGRSQGQVA